MLLSTIVITASSSFSLGAIIGAIIADRIRLNYERDRNYENLIYYLDNVSS